MALFSDIPNDARSNTKIPFLGSNTPDSSNGVGFADALNLSPELSEKINLRQNSKRNRKFKGPKTVSNNNIFLSYPIARSPSEKTGDTLLIKCIEYVPPKDGFGLEIDVQGIYGFKKNEQGQRIPGTSFVLEDKHRNDPGGAFHGVKPKIGAINFTDGNQRMTENQKIKYYVELPAPQEINDSNSITWGEDTLNALELAGLNVATKFIDNPANAVGDAQKAIGALSQGVNIDDVDEDLSRAIRASISGAAIGALGSNVSSRSVISRSTGKILNSNTELLFQGVNLRSFPFSVTFTPRTPEEVKVVKTIIRSFKQSMAPKAGDFNGSSATGIFLKSPDLFQLKYRHDGKDHPFLNAFKVCALTGMSVNYTNAGTYATYDDGSPVAIRMNMTFKEINPIYNEDYAEDMAGDGVGY